MNAEQKRLTEKKSWKHWGPYLSERAWGTVRDRLLGLRFGLGFFPPDHARSRTYRWNEDGIAGVCDEIQKICLSVAFWNGRDAILKERVFGLTGSEGNHGEDVKEYYFYLDPTPTHSYLKYLYKYPQAEFPYARLLEENEFLSDYGIRTLSRFHQDNPSHQTGWTGLVVKLLQQSGE